MTTGNKIEKSVSNKSLLLIVLAIVILLSLVSETTKTIPVGSSENFKRENLDAVSYTHLTLPTKASV